MQIIDLPYDVFLCIFEYLPSTSLFAFRAVSKQIYTLPFQAIADEAVHDNDHEIAMQTPVCNPIGAEDDFREGL